MFVQIEFNIGIPNECHICKSNESSHEKNVLRLTSGKRSLKPKETFAINVDPD